MRIHEKAPNFQLPDQDGNVHQLNDYLGKWVVLYFYPKDDTPGCTTEACSFRDSFDELRKHDVMIFGVSMDSVESHKKFVQKHRLNFPLLADTEAVVSKLYGAWDPKGFKDKPESIRETFLIDPEGDLAEYYPNVDPLQHVQQIRKDLQRLNTKI